MKKTERSVCFLTPKYSSYLKIMIECYHIHIGSKISKWSTHLCFASFCSHFCGSEWKSPFCCLLCLYRLYIYDIIVKSCYEARIWLLTPLCLNSLYYHYYYYYFDNPIYPSMILAKSFWLGNGWVWKQFKLVKLVNQIEWNGNWFWSSDFHTKNLSSHIVNHSLHFLSFPYPKPTN